MMMKKLLLLAGFWLVSLPILPGQAMVGSSLPSPIGFTQAAPSFPLQNLTEFDYLNLEGQVAVVVYHASW